MHYARAIKFGEVIGQFLSQFFNGVGSLRGVFGVANAPSSALSMPMTCAFPGGKIRLSKHGM
ncbi:MAG: hypothetical protein EXR27_21925 [Betaproteobacteria bacterium]|nr:hypothetical protein [Betaproteobacteria bacterium]